MMSPISHFYYTHLLAFSMVRDKFSQGNREKGKGTSTLSSKTNLEITLEVITLRKQIYNFCYPLLNLQHPSSSLYRSARLLQQPAKCSLPCFFLHPLILHNSRLIFIMKVPTVLRVKSSQNPQPGSQCHLKFSSKSTTFTYFYIPMHSLFSNLISWLPLSKCNLFLLSIVIE